MKIINLTQHKASAEQVEAGVFDLPETSILRDVLTFREIPTVENIKNRAQLLAGLALTSNADAAMIGGAPYLMGALEKELKSKGVQPMYSFTERVSVEVQNPDGTVTKTAVFKHQGWVKV